MRRRHIGAHRVIWLVLTVLLPVVLGAAWWARPAGAPDAPVRLSP